VRCSSSSDRVGFLGRLGRVFKEKAKSDIQLLFSGFSKTRENLAVIDELLTYWNLSDSENILDELEEVLVCRLLLSLVRLFWFTLPALLVMVFSF
jgi:fused signal recognition particle receptor